MTGVSPSSQDNADDAMDGRRPLKVRDIGLFRAIAVWLSKKNITPNQISIFSVFFAALASFCLLLIPFYSSTTLVDKADSGVAVFLLPVLAAVFIQCRLLCNLFDGMVAVEGGKSTASGELFNDIPDRIADPFILIAAGYAAIAFNWGEALGFSAALFAVLTAYVRTLSVSIGAPADFGGPMAKQHRMAIMTVACLVTSFETLFWPAGYSLIVALILICFGCIVTLFCRTRRAFLFLENQQKNQ